MTRQTLPPVTCAPWCTQGDGHPNYIFASDQVCYGPFVQIELAMEDVEVFAIARRYGDLPVAHVSLDLERCELTLTADEAERLGRQLIAAAELVR